jgi:hypothetical protein
MERLCIRRVGKRTRRLEFKTVFFAAQRFSEAKKPTSGRITSAQRYRATSTDRAARYGRGASAAQHTSPGVEADVNIARCAVSDDQTLLREDGETEIF